MGGTQSRSGCYGEEKNLDPARNGTPAIRLIAHCYTVSKLMSNEPLKVGTTPGNEQPNIITFHNRQILQEIIAKRIKFN
jgi:hypothetical protein